MSENKKKGSGYDYNCVMIGFDNVPAIKEIQKQIDKDDLYVKKDDNISGLEKESHVTVIYGIEPNGTCHLPCLNNYDITLDELKCLFTKISLFENEKFDVLKYDIVSAKLEEFRNVIRETLDFQKRKWTNTYPGKYQPHATIAYLKKGKGKKYLSLKYKKNFILKPDELIYSTVDAGTVNNRGFEIKSGTLMFRENQTREFKMKYIYEGLIKTYPAEQTINYIKKKFNLSDEEIYVNDTYSTYKDYKPQLINVVVNRHNNVYKYFDDIIKAFNTCGYFLTVKNYKDELHTLFMNKTFLFEPKYPMELSNHENYSNKFYHITLTVSWLHKIKEIGLCPKSQAKIAEHPDRVYLFKGYNESGIERMIFQMYIAINKKIFKMDDKNKDISFSVLEITPRHITLNNDTPIIFKDPQSDGYFTMDNIDPTRLKEVARYSLNDNRSELVKLF
jgi:hypothetical protein